MTIYQKNELDQIPSEAWYQASIAELSSRFPDDAAGFFGPESVTWKIYREPGILIGSYKALLLQVAHPAVGAGVKIYSNFQKDYLGRAYRTFLNMSSIFFGSCSLAKKTANHLHSMHYRICGSYIQRNGEEKKFCANEPQLLTWILATLVATSIQAYDLLRPALTLEEKNRFIKEAQITAQLMGIPPGFFPESYESFVEYFTRVLESKQLEIGSTAEHLATDILRGPFPFLRKANRLFATALLPKVLIEQYQLEWNKKLAQRFQNRMSFIRRFYSWWPDAIRHAPPYYQALYRVAKSKKESPKKLSVFFHWLGKHIKVPFLIREIH